MKNKRVASDIAVCVVMNAKNIQRNCMYSASDIFSPAEISDVTHNDGKHTNVDVKWDII